MKPAPFVYHDPRTQADALNLLASRDNARLLAGGQSLMPMLNFRVLAPDHLIDLNRVEGLAGITRRDGCVAIGAMTRQRAIERSDLVRQSLPLLQEALAHVGHAQTRNRGTLGGSLCHLDPAAELLTAAVALDATLIAANRNGTRRIPVSEWGRGYLTNALAAGEMLTEAELPMWPAGHGHAFIEYARRHGDFAIVGIAVLMTLDNAGAIRRTAIAVGGCGASPVRLTEAEAALAGRKPSAALFADAARLAGQIEAATDAYVSADYRRHLARVLTERGLAAASARARTGAST